MLNRAGLVIALTKQDRVEIEKRLKAMPDSDPGARLNRRLAQFIDAPAGVAGEIRHLASAANYPEKALLAQWAAYYHEPELSLDLLAEAAPNLSLPSVLWQPQMRDVRKLPAFKEVVRRMGLVDYWRTYRWSDFCHPLSKDDFVCG